MTAPQGRVRLIAAVSVPLPGGTAAIAAALEVPRGTERGSEFPGRRSTRVWADDATVVKIRDDVEWAARDAERWVEARVERERALGCYPPERSWFVLDADDGDPLRIGVATSRRRPLHLWSDAELEAGWPRFCAAFAALYLDAAEQGWRLDEGLSNLAWDADGVRLRYLDDDLYAWDRGTALQLGLPALARRLGWLAAEHGEALGRALREELRRRPLLLASAELADALRLDGTASPFLAAVAAELVRPDAHPASAAGSGAADGATLVIADVHANLEALTAVLASDDARGASRILVLGDVVGYGPDPQEVVERLASDERVVAVLGNHDAAAVEGAPSTFNADARWSAEWTREHLDAEALSWLGSLPRERDSADGWLAVHGAPIDPARFNAYVYRMTADDNLDALELAGHSLCFHGNTHVAGSWVRRARTMPGEFVAPELPLALERYRAALVCPGGLGQPRDGIPGAAYAVLEPDARRIRFGRVDYDLGPVQERMRRAAFPDKLIARLGLGR